MSWLTLDRFREQAAKGEVQPQRILASFPIAKAEAEGDDGARRVRVTISTGCIDRDNDTIDPAGWDVSDYLRNPVVLFGHDYRSLPVARCVAVEQRADALVATAEFPAAGVYAFADQVYAMVKAGFLNATSVGFKPLTWTYDETRRGVNYLTQALLEFSFVPVPANQEALILARAPADDPRRAWAQTLKAWAEAALGEDAEPDVDPALLAAIDRRLVALAAQGPTAAQLDAIERRLADLTAARADAEPIFELLDDEPTADDGLDVDPDELAAMLRAALAAQVPAQVDALVHRTMATTMQRLTGRVA